MNLIGQQLAIGRVINPDTTGGAPPVGVRDDGNDQTFRIVCEDKADSRSSCRQSRRGRGMAVSGRRQNRRDR